MSDNIEQRSSDMQKMITDRAAAEIARLQQQEQAMKHRIEHDKTVRNTQIEQTATAAEQRRKQAELAKDMHEKVYDQMSKVGPAAGMGYPGAGYGGMGGYGMGRF